MAKKGIIKLFFSQELISEQKARSRNHYFNELKNAQQIYKFSIDREKSHNILEAEYKKQESFKKIEAEELQFWSGTPINPVFSSFDNLMTIAQFADSKEILNLDLKGEAARVGQLIESYGIKPQDAIHTIHAYSAQVNYFLTEDIDLIKRAKRVPWLSEIKFVRIEDLISDFWEKQ